MAPLLEALGGFNSYISSLQGDSRHDTLELYQLLKEPAKGNVTFRDECGEEGGWERGCAHFSQGAPPSKWSIQK